jgi:thiamine-phosphate pyrophosphorylase
MPKIHAHPFPRFYPILDVSLLRARGVELADFASALRQAGVEWLQYRNKQGSEAEILQDAAALRNIFSDTPVRLILNDYATLLARTGFDGVHVGQGDLVPDAARAQTGHSAILGVSTHTPEQAQAAEASDCDYIACGPVFATATKKNPDPVIGLEGVRSIRRITGKPLVAIGGITRANCRSVLDAGADAVAVISDLLPAPGSMAAAQKIAEEFLALLRAE